MPVKVPTTRGDWETQALVAHTYNKYAPTTGNTLALPNDASMVSVRPAGTLAALTVTLPVAPVDGHTVRIFSTQIITALTLTPGAGQTINDAATTITPAMSGVAYIYGAGNNTWDRVL